MRFPFLPFAAALVASQACVGSDPTEGAGPVKDETSPDGSVVIDPQGSSQKSRLSLSVEPFRIVRGRHLDVQVSFTWLGAPVPFTLAWAGLKPGMDGGTGVVINPGAASATLSLSVSDTVPFGEVELQLVASSEDGRFQSTPLALQTFVRGAPGSVDTSFGINGEIEQLPNAPAAFLLSPDPNGGFAVTGRMSEDLVVARYHDGGMLDKTFATQGWARVARPTSSFTHTDLRQIPASTLRVNDDYRVASYWIREGAFFGSLSVINIASNGTSTQYRAPAAPNLVGIGTGLPESDGAWMFPAFEDAPVRYDAAGAAIAAATQSARPPCAAEAHCGVHLLAASNVAILGYTNNDSWKGLSLIERSTGRRLYTHAVEGSYAATDLPDGGFFALATDGTGIRLDSQHRASEFSGSTALQDTSNTILFVRKSGQVAALRTDESLSLVLQDLTEAGAPAGASLSLAPVSLTLSAPGSAYASHAMEDGQQRLVVFYAGQRGQVTSTVHANPYWLIRRYWL